MYWMSKLRCDLKRRSALVGFCFAVMLSQGCASRDPLHSADGTSAVNRESLPFHSENPQIASGSDSTRPAVPPDPKSASAVPFHGSHPRVLPSGTLLTVQLVGSLSASKVHAGDAFAAAVAAPITFDGVTLVDRGTAVTGRVESAQSEIDRVRAMGYFELTLDAMTVAGKPVVLQTSSLFARGTIQPSSDSSGSNNIRSNSIRVQKGRRLTFRLTAPVIFDDPGLTANRGTPDSTTE
jgi:hypothetical protein